MLAPIAMLRMELKKYLLIFNDCNRCNKHVYVMIESAEMNDRV